MNNWLEIMLAVFSVMFVAFLIAVFCVIKPIRRYILGKQAEARLRQLKIELGVR